MIKAEKELLSKEMGEKALILFHKLLLSCEDSITKLDPMRNKIEYCIAGERVELVWFKINSKESHESLYVNEPIADTVNRFSGISPFLNWTTISPDREKVHFLINTDYRQYKVPELDDDTYYRTTQTLKKLYSKWDAEYLDKFING